MLDLPAGRVTFLFTDIEGSTRLLRALGERYGEALSDHRRLLRACFVRHGGVEVDTQGDSFFVSFPDADEALAAAEDAQRALVAHGWSGAELRVRMGLHTGEPLVTDGHYVGIDVHRGARIAAAAHGGQVVVSERTHELVCAGEAPPVTLRDLGLHRLKDLPEPERIFQLVARGLPSSFPPLRTHEEAIEAAGLPDYSLAPADVPCPYKGLLPFQPEDRELFFGREQLVKDLAERLRGSSVLAVVGPSGSGKSSLVRAGLVPALQEVVGEARHTAIVTPGVHPLQQLERSGEAALLVVDQFEEVFTLCRDEQERSAFIEALLDRAEGETRVIVALRADFYGHCAAYPRLASALEECHALVGPMTEEELRRAIERPAERAGLVVEPGLVEAIVRDVAGQPGGLPLLSHSLLETWKRRSGRMLTVIGYLQSGGVQGAIAKTAETVYRDRLSPAEQALARSIFLRLTELGEGTEDTRRRVAIRELIPRREQEAEVREVLLTLADARLVTVGEDTVELAHEALIRSWPTLRSWLDADREGQLLHRRLTEAAQEWEALARDPGALLRGTRLAATGDWATAHDPELNELEREFLAASRQASEREAERQRRTNRRLRTLLVGALVLLALAIFGGAIALVQRSHARHAEGVAKAQALTADAKRLGVLAGAETSLDRKMPLALAGLQLESLPETRGALLGALQDSPAVFRFIRPSQVQIRALAATPDTRLLAAADSFGVVRFYDLRAWKEVGAAVPLSAPVSQQAAAFSPDGRRAAFGTVDRNHVSVEVVQVGPRTSRRLGSWPSIPASAGPLRFIRLAFSPDSRRIAVAVATAAPGSPVPVAQRLLLIDAATGEAVWERRYPLRPGQNEVQVEFTPGGEIVTSAQQGETLLWNAKNGRIERRFTIGGPFALSPNGRLAAVAQNNANPSDPTAALAVLNLRTGRHRLLQTLPVRAWLIGLQFMPDGKRVIGASFEGALRVWNVEGGSIEQTFGGQISGENLAIVRGGTAVVAGSQGGSVTAWDLSGAQRLGRTFQWNASNMGCPSVPCFTVNPMSTAHGDEPGRRNHRPDRSSNPQTGRDPAGSQRSQGRCARLLPGRPDACDWRRERPPHLVGHDPQGDRTDPAPRCAGDLDGREPRRRAHCDSDPRPRERGFSSRSPRPFVGRRAVRAPTRIGHGPRRSRLQPRRPKARGARLLRARLRDRSPSRSLGSGALRPPRIGQRDRVLPRWEPARRGDDGRKTPSARHARRGRESPADQGRHGDSRIDLVLAERASVRGELCRPYDNALGREVVEAPWELVSGEAGGASRRTFHGEGRPRHRLSRRRGPVADRRPDVEALRVPGRRP